jgi:glyoxylase-like metal-dependent hydrolase (beta-lactamase superfamily II)
LENARRPNVREKASYLPENVNVISMVNHRLTEDGQELWPGITVHESNGHTSGLHWIKVTDAGTTVVYPADLCPTSKHLPLPFVMGYDMCAETALREKAEFLRQAVEGNWIICFEHDPELAAARVRFDEKGRAVISEKLDLQATA